MRNFVIEGGLFTEQPIATCSKDLMDRKGGNMKPIPVPSATTRLGERLMFPASGLRGTWRRAARDVVRKKVIEKTGNEKPFSLDEHYLLTLGGIKGDEGMDRSSVAALDEWRRKNPLLSLFGAGDAGILGFVSGNLSVGNAVCKDPCEPVIFSGARSDDLYRDKTQINFLTDEDLDSLILRAKGGKVRSTISAEIKALDKEAKKLARAGSLEEEAKARQKIESLEAELLSNKTSTGTSSNSIGMPLAGWQAIPQGQELEQRLMLRQSNLVELGLLIEALNQFAKFPILGAHYANGCGLVSGQWEFFEVLENTTVSLGTISFEPFYPLKINSVVLGEAREAFAEFMQTSEWDFSIPGAK
ncbi:hypothetical protein [Undibacterium sp.]|uniref:hypothetical protein n=1 Tax=Undibacterium sp. TaxID=1914977 RepID=UPI0037539FBD